MKKLLIVVAAIALVVWVASWFRTPEAVATAVAHPWPGGMGTLDAADARFPPVRANDASRRLAALAKSLPKNEAADAFVLREIARGELAVGAPPAVLPDVAAIRELLLREPVVWERRGGVGNVGDSQTTAMRALLMTSARALVGSALVRARANDAAAWDDLRAVWNLSRSLDGQPEMMMQTAAFSMARMVNAVAWRMPLPAPPWLAELQQRDDVRRLLEGFQAQTASYWKSYKAFPTKALAESVEHDRRIAEALANETRCDVSAPMNELGVDLASVWRRAFRTRAEREATANALRIREGKPIEPSRCRDGSWSFDGATLRFSREIAVGKQDRPMPLALRLEP